MWEYSSELKNMFTELKNPKRSSAVDKIKWKKNQWTWRQSSAIQSIRETTLQSCLTLCDPVDCSNHVPLPMGFFWQEHWSGLPCPPLGGLPDPGIKQASPASPSLGKPPGKHGNYKVTQGDYMVTHGNYKVKTHHRHTEDKKERIQAHHHRKPSNHRRERGKNIETRELQNSQKTINKITVVSPYLK